MFSPESSSTLPLFHCPQNDNIPVSIIIGLLIWAAVVVFKDCNCFKLLTLFVYMYVLVGLAMSQCLVVEMVREHVAWSKDKNEPYSRSACTGEGRQNPAEEMILFEGGGGGRVLDAS